jgi:N6-L-threonylcarbamoyladenine synthase
LTKTTKKKKRDRGHSTSRVIARLINQHVLSWPLEMAARMALVARRAQLLLYMGPVALAFSHGTVPCHRRALTALACSATSGSGAERKKVGLPKSVQPPGAVDDGFLRAAAVPDFPRLDGSPFTVLGIETSCDDTGVAIVSSDGTILGEALASQAALHEEWGGVVPGIARDAHAEALDRVVAEALSRANMSSVADVDAIGVTVGPGLEICLRVGCEGAKALASAHGKPFVGVHHLEAHVLMTRLAAASPASAGSPTSSLTFPFLTLLTSGGHCQLLLSRGVGAHEVLGSTLDDALGEAFDKVARLLELPIGGGGGPALEALAREGNPKGVPLPTPMQRKKSLDFSFAGLKTAVRLAVEKAPEEARGTRAFQADVAASFQNSAFSHLEQRLRYAFDYIDDLGRRTPGEEVPRTLVVSGGVAANAELRRRLQSLCETTRAPAADDDSVWELMVPPPRLCTDNGVMVAWAAIEMLKLGVAHDPEGQEVRARWPLGRLAEGIVDLSKPRVGAKKRSVIELKAPRRVSVGTSHGSTVGEAPAQGAARQKD